MSIFKKLSDLNQDIEILENYQNFKAANILHKKFLKEAQDLKPSRETATYVQVFNKYLTNAQTSPSQSLINQIRADGFLFKEDQDKLINLISSKMTATTPTPTPAKNPTETPKVNPQDVSKTPLVSISANNQQQSAFQTLSDTANYNAAMESFYSGENQASQANQPQNTMTNQKVNEQQLYMDSLNDIIELFKTKRPEAINEAEQIYVDTYTQLTNQSSKTLFARQIQRLRNQYNIARLKGQR